MKEILINDVIVRAFDITDEVLPNEFKNNKEERTLKFSFQVEGEQNYRLFSNLLKDKQLKIISEELGINQILQKKNSISRYTGQLNQYTEVTFDVELIETNDRDLTDKELMARGLIETIFNKVKTRVLADLLIEKGIITEEEYEEKLFIKSDEYIEKFKNEILDETREEIVKQR
jgi:hypothetical protein